MSCSLVSDWLLRKLSMWLSTCSSSSNFVFMQLLRGSSVPQSSAVALAAAPEAAECEFCCQTFKARGLRVHQSRCIAKIAKIRREPPPRPPRPQHNHNPPQLDPQPRFKFRFRLGNEHVSNHVLSFLSNQSLTKMQLVTGDRYASCEPLLSRICCACENDNPALFDGLCSACASTKRGFDRLITMRDAKKLYCLKDLAGLPTTLKKYAHADLDRHAEATYGSRREWLRVLGPHTARIKRLAANKQHRHDDLETRLQPFSPVFTAYALSHRSMKGMSREEFAVCSRRFDEVAIPLSQRGVELEKESNICYGYIAMGRMDLWNVVDNSEEKAFLLRYTNYLSRSGGSIAAGREELGEDYFSEEEDRVIHSCRDDAKAALCVEFLLNNRGLALPRKWELCRARLNQVCAAFGNPMAERLYVYKGLSDEYIESDYY